MSQTAVSNKKFYLIFTLCFLGFGLIVALLTSFINYKSNFTDINDKLQDMANSEAMFKREFLFNHISEIEMLLSSIKRNELTLKYIRSETIKDKENLIHLFHALSYTNRNIMQLRYIDVSGKEIIRIDRDRKTPELLVVPQDELQDKSGRYYFREASLLMANQFWHSNIDLNIEHGKIEDPIKPTFRVATPLVVENRFKGILIANLLFENKIKQLASSANFYVYIVDKDGEIIHHPDYSGSWSKYLDNKKNLHGLFPGDVNNILNNRTFNAEGIYSYTLGDLFKNGENIKIIFVPKSFIVASLHKKNILSALLIAGTILLVTIPLSWVVSIIPSQLQSKLAAAFSKIREHAEIIDKYVMVSTTDKQGKIGDISTFFTKTTGYKASEVIGKSHGVLKHPDTPIETHKDLWETILSGRVWEGDLKNCDKNNRSFWIHQVVTPKRDKDHEIIGFTAVSQDITDKKIIEQMSLTDSLTGLYNRRELKKVLSGEMARFDRHQSNFSIIMIDIDFFKTVNDTHGHQAGDDVLIHMAAVLKDNTRKNDCVSRWGGEEFLIVAGGADLDSAFVLAEKMRTKIENYKFSVVGRVTISCGVVQYITSESTSKLVARADKALYQAKESGRNKVVKG